MNSSLQSVSRMPTSRILSWVAGMILAATLLWFYWPVLIKLVITLIDSTDASFGLLLPLVSAYIVYRKWPEIRQLPWQPSWAGLLVMAGGLCLYLFGALITDVYTPALSFVVVLGGLVILMGGWSAFRVLWFPVVLLTLMIPLPQFINMKFTLHLQLISSKLAAGMLKLYGLPLLLQGNVIDLGTRQLNVVAACSGLRYIYNLIALGIIFSFFFQRRLWKAAVLVMAMVPFAIFANALRIATIGIFPTFGKGLWHTSLGLSFFLLGFDYLKLINWTVGKVSLPNPGEQKASALLSPKAMGEVTRPSYTVYLVSALMLVVVSGPAALRLSQVPPMPLKQSLEKFPMQLGTWQGSQIYIDPEIVKATNCNAYLNAKYINSTDGVITLWIAYYEKQEGGASMHSPFSCLTGSGWKTLASGVIYIGKNRPVKYMLIEELGNRRLVYYWFIERGRWLANEYFHKFYIGYDRLLKRRSDGALIRLITPVGDDLNDAKNRLDDFTRLVSPLIFQYLPE